MVSFDFIFICIFYVFISRLIFCFLDFYFLFLLDDCTKLLFCFMFVNNFILVARDTFLFFVKAHAKEDRRIVLVPETYFKKGDILSLNFLTYFFVF